MFFNTQGKVNLELCLNKFKIFVQDKNQPFVLICRSSNRTESVGNFLSKELKI